MIAKQIGENAIFSHNVTELRGERKREREKDVISQVVYKYKGKEETTSFGKIPPHLDLFVRDKKSEGGGIISHN